MREKVRKCSERGREIVFCLFLCVCVLEGKRMRDRNIVCECH